MSQDAQTILNGAGYRIHAGLRAVEQFSGPKELWAEWLVDRLEEELLQLANIKRAPGVSIPRIIQNVQKAIYPRKDHAVDINFSAIRAGEDPEFRNDGDQVEENVKDLEGWVPPPPGSLPPPTTPGIPWITLTSAVMDKKASIISEPIGAEAEEPQTSTASPMLPSPAPSSATLPEHASSLPTLPTVPVTVTTQDTVALPPTLDLLKTKRNGPTVKLKVTGDNSSRAKRKTKVGPSEVPDIPDTLPKAQEGPSSSSSQLVRSSEKRPGSAMVKPQTKKRKRQPPKTPKIILSSEESSPEPLRVPTPDQEPNETKKTKTDKGKAKAGEKEEISPTESIEGDLQHVCNQCHERGESNKCKWPPTWTSKSPNQQRACFPCRNSKVKCIVDGRPQLRQTPKTKLKVPGASRPSPLGLSKSGPSELKQESLAEILRRVEMLERTNGEYRKRVAVLEDYIAALEKDVSGQPPGKKD